jgi:hypothetical protein
MTPEGCVDLASERLGGEALAAAEEWRDDLVAGQAG